MSETIGEMKQFAASPTALAMTGNQHTEGPVASLDAAGPHMQRQPQVDEIKSTKCGVSTPTNAVRVLSPVSRRRVPGEADLGWAAGIMDGEGCIHIARQTYGTSGRRPTYRLRLQITQNDETLLKEFEWSVGVAGRIYSPKPSRKQNKVCHTLNYDGTRAFTVLARLFEHLRRKRPQAALAVEFRDNCDIHRHTGPKGCSEAIWELRQWYYERMRDLKWC